MEKCTTFRVKGQVYGVLFGDVLRRTAQASRHFLRKPPAICIDLQTLELAEDAGARKVEVVDTESGRIYRADVQTIHRYGRKMNRGYGLQIALALGRWALNDPAQPLQQGSLLAEAGL